MGFEPKDWVFVEVQVALDVRKVVLLHVGKRRLTKHHGDVLIGRVALLGSGDVFHDLVDAGTLICFKNLSTTTLRLNRSGFFSINAITA